MSLSEYLQGAGIPPLPDLGGDLFDGVFSVSNTLSYPRIEVRWDKLFDAIELCKNQRWGVDQIAEKLSKHLDLYQPHRVMAYRRSLTDLVMCHPYYMARGIPIVAIPYQLFGDCKPVGSCWEIPNPILTEIAPILADVEGWVRKTLEAL